jgi:phospholipase/carboxylesterase
MSYHFLDGAGAQRPRPSCSPSTAPAVHPEIVDDLVLLHPLILWEPAAQPGLAGRRVLITAGRRDPICPAPMTDRLAEWFGQQGADLSLVWHPGGHEIAQSELAAIQEFAAPVAA